MEKIFLFFSSLVCLFFSTPLVFWESSCSRGHQMCPQVLWTYPRLCYSTDCSSAVCGNKQVLSGGNTAGINTSPYQLLPPHYNLEIYLLPNRPSSARLHLESFLAAFFLIKKITLPIFFLIFSLKLIWFSHITGIHLKFGTSRGFSLSDPLLDLVKINK